jgi:hypothetical protein
MSEHSEELEELSGELLSGNRKDEDEKELQRFRPEPAEYARLVFTKTESPAALDRLAKKLAASRRKVRACEPLSASIMFPAYKLLHSSMIERLGR